MYTYNTIVRICASAVVESADVGQVIKTTSFVVFVRAFDNIILIEICVTHNVY